MNIGLAHNLFSTSRPFWDKGLKDEYARWKIINNLGTGGGQLDPSNFCPLSNFTVRSTSPRLFDAFLFSYELDLLEIRLHELDSVVDVFVIYESSCTFSGLNKPLVFDSKVKQRPEFVKFIHKIRNIKEDLTPEECVKRTHSGFSPEHSSRRNLFDAVREVGGARDGDLLHWSDLDEIPSLDSIRLLKECEFGDRIHLQLDTYLYSFEWRRWPDYVFRSTVSVLGRSISDSDIIKRFTYITDVMLGDAGWHCSWCLRSIDDILSKMHSYAHNDRLDHDPTSLTNRDKIKEKVCSGHDVFGYLPEAVDYAGLLAMMNPVPAHGISRLPLLLSQHPEKFRYLLPGGCGYLE